MNHTESQTQLGQNALVQRIFFEGQYKKYGKQLKIWTRELNLKTRKAVL